MLKKCLKYDLHAILPIWWILALSILLISPIGGLSIRVLVYGDEVYNALGIFPLILSGLGITVTAVSYVALFLATEILICYRYYQNFFTDSGYLTFTLPVRRSTLFLSKVISGIIWNFGTVLVLLFGASLLLLVIPGAQSSGELVNDPSLYAVTALGTVLKGIGFLFSSGWAMCGAWLLLYIFEAIVLLITIFLSSLLFLYLCITIGCMIAKKNKVLVSIALYYGFNWGVSLLSSVFYTFSGTAVTSTLVAYPEAFANNALLCALAAVLLLLFAVVLSVICAVYWLSSLSSIERRLNLQ